MKIQQITSQHRRDFRADMVCEKCGAVERGVSGYDDANFHNNVVPAMACKQCGEKAPRGYRPLATKHPAGVVV